MQGRKSALRIEIDDPVRATLLGWLRRQKTPVGLAKRAQAILLLAESHTFAATARQVDYVNGMCASGRCAFSPLALMVYTTKSDRAGGRFFPRRSRCMS